MIENLYKEFLNIFWLRPENAMLVSLRANEVLKYHQQIGNGQSIDVSCGDGLFSFITLGGKLDRHTDMFQTLKYTKGYRTGDFDTFDNYDETYYVGIEKTPSKKFSYGSDWKNNLICKAAKLNIYEDLIVHDNNQLLPFEKESFNYVYSNSTYWVENFEQHIKNLINITAPNGLIVLEMKVDNIKNYTSMSYLPEMGGKFHEIIDGGRLSTWNGLRSFAELNDLFSALDDVVVEEVKPIYGGELAMIWDIGLRPLFKPLSKMANNLDSEYRKEIKEEWMTIFHDLFTYKLQNYRAEEKSAIEFLFVLRKK